MLQCPTDLAICPLLRGKAGVDFPVASTGAGQRFDWQDMFSYCSPFKFKSSFSLSVLVSIISVVATSSNGKAVCIWILDLDVTGGGTILLSGCYFCYWFRFWWIFQSIFSIPRPG